MDGLAEGYSRCSGRASVKKAPEEDGFTSGAACKRAASDRARAGINDFATIADRQKPIQDHRRAWRRLERVNKLNGSS
jgi:hypothetical protein